MMYVHVTLLLFRIFATQLTSIVVTLTDITTCYCPPFTAPTDYRANRL